jgi:signal transduction histidine kinase
MLEAVSQMELSLTNALEFFRAGARAQIQREPIAINDVVGEVLRLFTPTAQANGVKLVGPKTDRAIVVSADRELLRRVVINLVANAILYTPSGGEVRVRLEDSSDAVTFSVSDTGPGIAESDRQRIFDKFYRAAGPDGMPQRIPGSGLGLAIAKQAVDMHKGLIWVDSEVGKGSTFQVELPKQASPSEASHV